MDTLLYSVSPHFHLEVENNPELDRTENDSSEDEIRVNIPVTAVDPFYGYTTLHKACIENDLDLVKTLVADVKADVNTVAPDGAQPLVIAGLLGHMDITKVLLDANADVNARFGRDIQLKYAKDIAWCNDFGDKITLAIFAIMNDNNKLMKTLKCFNPHLKFISRSNKTLLMYAIEKNNYDNAEVFENVNDEEFLNICDNDGISAIHYVVHKKKYGEFRYDQKQLMIEDNKAHIVGCLLRDGADIHSTTNDDPETFLLNSAAYRAASEVIHEALPYYTFITQSRALYYATLPVTDSEKYLRPDNGRLSLYKVHENRRQTIDFILKDLVNRRIFGFFIPEEEKKMMDKLIATDTDVKNMVINYEKNYIHGVLKNTVIEYGYNTSITFFDFVMKVGPSDKKLRPFVRDGLVKPLLWVFECDDRECYWFVDMFSNRIKNIEGRWKLLETLKSVSILRKFFPLPYELVLNIVDYLNNHDLEKFINSFF